MNESIPPIAPFAPTAPAYKDRSTGLLIFGILTMLLGCLSALLVPLMLFGQVAAAKAAGASPNFAAILPAIFFYGVLAVALIWLGIGSIRARRWARALLLIFSWSWLLMGIFTVIAMAFIMPKVLGNVPSTGTSPAPMGIVMIVMFLFLGFFFVLLPGLWIFFYNSPHVKATCEVRHDVTGWTDACPLPVLGLSLWLIVSAPMMLIMPLVGKPVMPFFGMFFTGAPAVLLCVAVAAFLAYAAWMIYHLKSQGWWLVLITLIVFITSSVVTFARHDVLEMYQLMGYPQAQIDEIQKTGLLAGNRASWFMVFAILPFASYLVFVKKYFRDKP